MRRLRIDSGCGPWVVLRAYEDDAERRGRHSHAERGNELRNDCLMPSRIRKVRDDDRSATLSVASDPVLTISFSAPRRLQSCATDLVPTLRVGMHSVTLRATPEPGRPTSFPRSAWE
jgi:hypothetical protein